MFDVENQKADKKRQRNHLSVKRATLFKEFYKNLELSRVILTL